MRLILEMEKACLVNKMGHTCGNYFSSCFTWSGFAKWVLTSLQGILLINDPHTPWQNGNTNPRKLEMFHKLIIADMQDNCCICAFCYNTSISSIGAIEQKISENYQSFFLAFDRPSAMPPGKSHTKLGLILLQYFKINL